MYTSVLLSISIDMTSVVKKYSCTCKPFRPFIRCCNWKPFWVAHLKSTWRPLGVHLESTWRPLGTHLETTWRPLGDHLDPTWSPLGAHLDST